MKYKLVAFDMDGTLLRGDGCWVKIHKHFGTLDRGDENLRAYEANRIDYEEFMRRDIGAWLSKNPRIHISKIKEILSNFKMDKDAAPVVSELKKAGCTTAIITSGIDFLAENVARKAGIEHVRANGLATDGRGYLNGNGLLGVDPVRKDDVLKELSFVLGIPLKKTVAVGDSKYDRNFLMCAGLGIAYNGDEEIKKEADAVIDSLRDVLRFIK